MLLWTGPILLGIGLFGLMGIFFNNFMFSLIIGILVLILSVITRLIVKGESNDAYAIGPEEYWFIYEIGGMPKPVRWQGWACYGTIFLSLFVVLIFVRDPNTATVIMVASIFVVVIIAMLKSNYRERIAEYKEDLKK
jgi:ascorbate-specific PTS system EIIC-type component UlaA